MKIEKPVSKLTDSALKAAGKFDKGLKVSEKKFDKNLKPPLKDVPVIKRALLAIASGEAKFELKLGARRPDNVVREVKLPAKAPGSLTALVLADGTMVLERKSGMGFTGNLPQYSQPIPLKSGQGEALKDAVLKMRGEKLRDMKRVAVSAPAPQDVVNEVNLAPRFKNGDRVSVLQLRDGTIVLKTVNQITGTTSYEKSLQDVLKPALDLKPKPMATARKEAQFKKDDTLL